jgi:hypothetical protein
MSRQRIPMTDGTLMVLGYDEPFETWYAIHFDSRDEETAPRAVIGYGPQEADLLRGERPDALIGPYPVAELPDLIAQIAAVFGLTGASEQPPCWYCKQPTYEPSPGCASHPYNRLRYGA